MDFLTRKVTRKAFAKINLALDVLGKRPDGYHELRMVMQSLALHDTLHISKNNTGIVSLHCDDAGLPVDDRNLVYQGAAYMLRHYANGAGLCVRLAKRIPVSAGLGGGSSDCAAVLAGANELFRLGLTKQQLAEIGLRFGADVPYCLIGGTVLAEGVGERLTPLPPHPPAYVLLVKPPAAVSTREIFTRFDPALVIKRPDIAAMRQALQANSLTGTAGLFGNVLTAVTARAHPIINELIDALRDAGALNAAMSGSGPTVFGYFERHAAAKTAAQTLRRAYPTVTIILTGVYNPSSGRSG